MIWEWKLPTGERNYGDALWEHVGAMSTSMLRVYKNDTQHAHCLIGSYIDNTVIDEILHSGHAPVFHHCGWRGNELDPKLAAASIFLGSRGPATQRALARAGIDVELTADPARYTPRVIPAGTPNNTALFIPHALDPQRDAYRASKVGVDLVIPPVVNTARDTVNLTKLISGANFVLAGALHAAIVAHAYNVPFAFYQGRDGGYLDCPAKWDDWLEWLGIDTAGHNYHSHSADGIDWWVHHSENMNS